MIGVKMMRKFFHTHLDPTCWPHSGLSPLNKVIVILVLACVMSAVLETEPTLSTAYASSFALLNKVFLYVFSVEYLLRLWVVGEDSRYTGIIGRLQYMITPAAIIDLITVAPFWFGAGSEILLLRLLRLLRILKLARIPSVNSALMRLYTAIKSRRMEFALSITFALLLMLVAATTLYFIEGDIQPGTFGSIPRSLWWGMATLTTVGYGDVYPITVLGKIAGGVYALAGIGLVAMPTGIFAAAMSEVVHNPIKDTSGSE